MSKPPSTFWDDDAERVEDLKRLWDRGDTVAQIGVILGTTPGSVISKVRRIGLPFRARPGAATTPRSPRRGNRNGVPNPADVARARSQLDSALARVAAEATAPPAHRQSLLLRDGHGRFHANEHFSDTKHCHWPLPTRSDAGLIEYCGAPAVMGTSWCQGHLRVVYHPIPISPLGRSPLEPRPDSVEKATPDFVPRVEEPA